MNNLSEEEKEAVKYLEFLSNEKCECEACQKAKKEYKTILNLLNKQQAKIKGLEKGNRSLMDSRKKWKDRYYKQKHEIEELREQNTRLLNYLNDTYYVSADKIREKIKAFQDVKKEIIKNENKLSRASITYDIVRNDYCEKMLQELLEEN